jgi:SRSO17 transposase
VEEAPLDRLEAYGDHFAGVLPRVDQRERMGLYLRGLLDGDTPKNSEAIASRVRGGEGSSGAAQALQHFLATSPWDAGQFLACYRNLVRPMRSAGPVLWVVHDVVFPKKGRHSVGTQRQFSRTQGRKLNCQIGVFLSEIHASGFFPLATRLYLPGYWLREYPDLAARLVPGEHRQQRSRADIALELLQEVRDEGLSAQALTGDPAYLADATLEETATAWGMALWHPREHSEAVSAPRSILRPYLTGEAREGAVAAPEVLAEAALVETGRILEWMRGRLGLGQFEGRSWLGWHHHVALVLAAYGFMSLEQPGTQSPPFQLT